MIAANGATTRAAAGRFKLSTSNFEIRKLKRAVCPPFARREPIRRLLARMPCLRKANGMNSVLLSESERSETVYRRGRWNGAV